MPHEIVMPALGMAQETGLIVSWLKSPGESVAKGEALIEIETDKAVMEVEAQASGYLSGVSAAAGEHVPVGQVIGFITDSLESVESATASDSSSDAASDNETEAIPEGHPFILPALGMAQDSGIVVNWRKAPGDRLQADDILLEVETDKSIMDVEAGRDGYLAAILAHEKDEVPVGSIVAVIADQKPENTLSRGFTSPESTPSAAATVQIRDSEADSRAQTAPSSAASATTSQGDASAVVSTPGGRILASPKARRLALEQGLNLEQLIAMGVPQPYHVADLETLNRAATTTAPATPTAEGSGVELGMPMRVTATVSRQGCDTLIRWLAESEGLNVTLGDLFLRYSAAAFRKTVLQSENSLCVGLLNARGSEARYIDPDSYRLSESIPQEGAQGLHLIVRNLTHSAITSIQATGGKQDTLSISCVGEQFEILFEFSAERCDELSAIHFTADFADRVADPLLNLL